MSAAREEETGWADDARCAELHRAPLVAVRVEDVSVRDDARIPELSLRIDGGSADDRLNEGNLALFHSSRRPTRGLRRDEVVDLPPFDVPFEYELTARIVFAEHRLTGEEDVIEAAGRIDERQSAVERQVQVALLLVPRRPQTSDGLLRHSGHAVLGDE